MNKEDIINILDKYNFDRKEYSVIAGASMVMHGIKDYTNDIDISVSEYYYNYLLNNYNCVLDRINEFNIKAYMIDNVINFSTSFMPNKKVYINNISVTSIEDIIKLKEFLKRDKDLKDIKILKKYKI